MAAQLSSHEREVISQGLHAGESDQEIAEQLGRHRTTIWRERNRNSGEHGYFGWQAHALAQQRRRRRPLVRKMQRPKVLNFVRKKLKALWAPEQIAGHLRRVCRGDRKRCVSHQTIYIWIRHDPERWTCWEKCLRGGGPHKKYRGPGISNAVMLAHRPAIVNRRGRYGDWEGDTVLGKRQQGCLVTHVDRKSGYLLAAVLPDRCADTVNKASAKLFGKLPARRRKTLTLDRGSEFSGHKELAQRTGLKVYFADPYAPWQRGTNENTNRLLRQYFPKGTDFRKVTQRQVQKAVHALNHRPRKRLNYKTPHEVFTKNMCCT